jgi:opacity protein-like surface antigen
MISHDKLDLFAGVGIGYNGSKWTFITDDPNFNNSEFNAIVPISFRLFVGGRYFFTNNLGLNFEFGAGGGGLLQGGISFRI